jgi:hypothetical protein
LRTKLTDGFYHAFALKTILLNLARFALLTTYLYNIFSLELFKTPFVGFGRKYVVLLKAL